MVISNATSKVKRHVIFNDLFVNKQIMAITIYSAIFLQFHEPQPIIADINSIFATISPLSLYTISPHLLFSLSYPISNVVLIVVYMCMRVDCKISKYALTRCGAPINCYVSRSLETHSSDHPRSAMQAVTVQRLILRL